MNMPQLTVMLTHNDLTVRNAWDIFHQCKDLPVMYWGFKEEPLPLDEMKALFSYMKQEGKKTVLEVVCYDEESSLRGAYMAAECGVDFLMGTTFSDTVNEFCQTNHLKYLPFAGNISHRPSILDGNIEDMLKEARRYLKKGVYGIDLLGYRYTGDAEKLIERFVRELDAPVCVAGSINSYDRLDTMLRVCPWSFTIGSAFFEHCFGDDLPVQISRVCQYMKQSKAAGTEDTHAF